MFCFQLFLLIKRASARLCYLLYNNFNVIIAAAFVNDFTLMLIICCDNYVYILIQTYLYKYRYIQIYTNIYTYILCAEAFGIWF